MPGNLNYRAIIVGTGQSGNPLATTLASAGWKTAVIESDQVGGTCINYGCTPTKTMVASAKVAYLVSRASEFGIEIPGWKMDLRKVQERKRKVVRSFRSSSENSLKNTENLDFYRGTARFQSEKEIEITSDSEPIKTLNGDHIVINTGTRTAYPPLPGLETVDYLDSTSIMELSEVPEHLIVLGGGYIGLEFGQMFRRFGSEVTIIQRGDQLLTREDRDVADEIAEILKEDGIEVFLNGEGTAVKKVKNGQIGLEVNQQNDHLTVKGSHLLVATGREPNTAELNLENAGVETDEKGYVRVDDFLRTSVPDIYASGDV
jgi:pyruvate/2-oxoglutarate dehydrogenase complex dihydrolipoamide dehydrogenase (E3) component